MIPMKHITSTLILSLSSGLANAADVTVGVPNWPTAAATSHILKVVMEDYLGLDVGLQNGTNAVIFEAMDKGTIDVHPEVWLPNQQSLHDKYVKERGTVLQDMNGVEATQGICVTREVSEQYGISSIYDLTNPETAKLFDRDGDGYGELWAGPPAAASSMVERIKAKSYGYDQTMKLYELDETLFVAELSASDKADKPIVFFCYSPHQMFQMYDLVHLEEPPHNPDTWHIIQPTDDPDWLEKSNADSAWPEAALYIHYAKKLESEQPAAANLLSHVNLDLEQINDMSYALTVDKKDPEAYAHEWVADHADLVESWLAQ
ncbi:MULTISPECIES: ABC transporter substrate-binding protein [Cobetia]|uniref:Glycine betaine ABC transporter substrate-binding protein n=3 Tax=Cobetia TaxID=204286 RepID=A0AAP4TX46_9GAMM|nr:MULTISPECIES: glycine betaine ABC transporter substrate-binding protein [Cobetia]MDO6671384.1 glycine betaine ABC transporter substrate-binding protein [Cobetia amphilecti]MDO6814150.1 glycine betaine ABC transporter substrate-binding protein [Cobetia amphilecti]GED41520.1 amino acid-binding protein [Cobetia marina]